MLGRGAGDLGQPLHSVVGSFRVPRLGLELDSDLQTLLDKKVSFAYQGEEEESVVKGLSSLFAWFLLLVLLGIPFVLLLQWVMGGNSPLTFGRSRHKLYAQKDLHITFKDVAGIDEAVAELREVVFHFVNAGVIGRYEATGFTRFLRVPSGAWIVDEWLLRLPRIASRPSSSGYTTIRERDCVLMTDSPRGSPVVAEARTAGIPPCSQSWIS